MNARPLLGLTGSALLLGAAVRWAADAAPPAVGASQAATAGPAAVDLRVEAQLGGALGAVATAPNRIFVGAGPRIVVLDTAFMGNPVEQGISEVLPGTVTALAVLGDSVVAGYGLRDEADPSGLVVLSWRWPRVGATLGRLALVGVPVGVKALGDTVVVVTRRQTEDGRPYPTAQPWPTATTAARSPGAQDASRRQGTGQPVVTTYRGGELLTVDVSDPSAPRIVGRLELAEVPVALDVDADRAFVLATDDGQGNDMSPVLLAVDLTDTSTPRRAGVLALGGSSRLGGGLDVQGDYAYVAAGNLDPGLVVVDVRNVAGMRAVTSWQSFATEVIRIGRYLYLADVPETAILDATDPTRLEWAGAFNESLRKFALLGDRLVATHDVFDAGAQAIGNRVGVGVFGILADDPVQLVPMGRWTSLSDLSSLAADGARLYVTVGTDLLATIDAADPLTPRQVAATWWTDPGNWSWIRTQMALGDGFLAMTQPAASPSSLFLADLGGQAPARASRLGLAAHAIDLAASERLVAVVVEPAFERGPPPWPRTPTPTAAVPPDDQAAPAQAAPPALRVFDAGDPAQPRELSSTTLTGAPVGVAMQGSTAYVATRVDLQVFDLSQPDAPRLVTTVAGVAGRSSMFDRSMVLAGKHLAVVTTDGVRLFDVALPDAPRDAGRLTIPDVIQVALSDAWLFAVTHDTADVDTVLAYPLEPLTTSPVAHFVVPDSVAAVAVQAGALVVATGDAGLLWLRPDVENFQRADDLRIWLPKVDTGRR